ncbi:MAG: S1 RNA-binding domain-containing protein [Streptosporangiales bacterium]|nr:S1 RNA-binding domain-containing protein [Streptosporangiales bacterium]
MDEPRVPLAAWQEFLSARAEGGVFEGEVVSVVPFGAFVEVGGGVHGLLHKSEWRTAPETGQTIRVRINQIDLDGRRVSLLPA